MLAVFIAQMILNCIINITVIVYKYIGKYFCIIDVIMYPKLQELIIFKMHQTK